MTIVSRSCRAALVFLAALAAACSSATNPPPGNDTTGSAGKPAGEVRGSVVKDDAGTPVAGALVSLDGSGLLVRTDANGAFVLTGVPAGEVSIEARSDAAGSPVGVQKTLDLKADAKTPALAAATDVGALAIGYYAKVHGVVRKDGTPLAGAQVVVQGLAATLAGADGTWELPVPRGTWTFAAAWKEGSVTRVHALPGTEITGDRALDIDVAAADPDNGTLTVHARPPAGVAPAGLPGEVHGASSAATSSDANGDFAFPDLPAGIYAFVVNGPGHAPLTVGPLAVGAAVKLDVVLLPANDCNGDGIDDATEADADFDGVPDAEEPPSCRCLAGHEDADADGICDALLPPAPPAAKPVGVTQLVSATPAGTLGNHDATAVVISQNGRFVAFSSSASDLVAGDTNDTDDVFLRDTCFGAPAGCTPSTERFSTALDGTEGDGPSREPAVSADGRYVAFSSAATDFGFTPADTAESIYLLDTCRGAPAGCVKSYALVTAGPDGSPMGGGGHNPSLSANGRYVAFAGGGDFAGTGARTGIYARDTCLGAPAGCTPRTVLVTVQADGAPATRGCGSPSLSPDGRYLAFWAFSNALVPGDTNDPVNNTDVFLRDTCFGADATCTPTTERVNLGPNDAQDASLNALRLSVSQGGRYVAFGSMGALAAGDTNGNYDVYVRDTCRTAGAGCVPETRLVSLGVDGQVTTDGAYDPWMSPDGRFFAFTAGAAMTADGVGGGSYVRDTCLGASGPCTPRTVLVSRASDGSASGRGFNPSISVDGRFFALSTTQPLLPGFTGDMEQAWAGVTGF